MSVECITNMPRNHRVGISAGGAFEANPALTIVRQLAFLSNNHVWQREFVEDEGHRGNPWLSSEGVVFDKGRGTGPLTLNPRADDLTAIFPLLIGGEWADGVLEPEVICKFFRMMIDKKIATFDHRDCKTASWSLTSSTGSPILQLEWNIESCKMSRLAAGTFQGGLDLSMIQPFVHSQATVTIDDVEYKVDDVTVNGENNLDGDIFYNSQTRTDLAQGNQVFQFTHTSPFDKAADLAFLDLGATSVSGKVEYIAHGGAIKLTIEFPALHSPVDVPISPAGNTPARYEGIQWTARTVGAGGSLEKPIKITLDDDPETNVPTTTTGA